MPTVDDDRKLYRNCMQEIRFRLSFVRDLRKQNGTGSVVIDKELVFLQLRKMLELIAFASLTANREKYAAAHNTFSRHWKAKAMLEELAKLNPDFYPLPVQRPQLRNGIKH